MIRWEAIRCVVFDFDGTLVESNAIKRDTYFEILAETPGSGPVIETVLEANPKADRYGVLAAVHEVLAERGVEPLPTLAALVNAYSRICEERVVSCPALPGAVETLESLRSTHTLHLDSATPTDALERVVARRGWRSFFGSVLGGPASKVDNLRSIADREGLPAKEMAYVGDGSADREAAQGFGCRFLGFRTPASDLPEESPLARLVSEIASRSVG